MSLPPSLWPRRLIDQDFGMCITPTDFIWPFLNSTNYYRPWNWCTQDVNNFASTIDDQSDSYKVTLDVQHFRPNEISVKVVNNQIIIEGKHEERKDEHGFVTRQFTRRYALPDNCLSEDVVSTLSSDGILTVIARKKSECEFKKNEKIVPIKFCKSCPLKAQGNNKNVNMDQKDETKQKTDEQMKTDKKNTQIMLKEDHCCLLLKPGILRDATAESAEIRGETKTQKEEYEQVKACKGVVTDQVKNTSDILQESLAQSNLSGSKETMKQTCDKTKIAISESAGIMEQTCGKSSTSTSAEMTEQVTVVCKSSAISASAGIMEQTCSKATAASSTEMMEQASGKSRTKEVVGQSSMTTSQMSEQTAMSSKTSEFIESSTSYKSSIASSIKEMSEELSDFVCDIICSELDENKDTKK